jgi:RNA polymerase sigma-70 factor (ECF subfamily)
VPVELAGGHPQRFPVEARGQRFAILGTVHVELVVRGGRIVPDGREQFPADDPGCGVPGRVYPSAATNWQAVRCVLAKIRRRTVDEETRLSAEEVTRAALAARDGDPAAASRFVRATQADVWRLCAYLGDPREADDLTQETYLRAFRALPQFAERSSARTWLLAIARRTCADGIRERRRRPPVDHWVGEVELPAAPDVSDGVALRAVLANLDPDRRQAFVLTQLVGLSYGEAAEVCGCPVGTIRSRVARARDDLVAALDGGTAHRAAGDPS